ncbi:hypothetical protein BDQ17DRAFT_1357457 [Cyathus striatus]|nr:hypothetical protein BDQ17DRAFT_1357457 [Cyathus striatus]
MHNDAAFINVSPAIHGLPPEVLSNIFELAYVSLCGDEKLPFSTTITSVCHRWRDTSVSLAYLWSPLRIRHFCQPEVLEIWLGRSQNYPLDLSIVVCSDICDKFGESSVGGPDWTKLYKVLALHIPRCDSLKISAEESGRALVNIIEFVGSIHLPILWKLVVIGPKHQARDYADNPILQLNLGALDSILEDVRLQGIATFICRPPLQNITTLHIALGPSSAIEFRQIIVSCPLLSTLAVFQNIPLKWRWSGNAINVPKLGSLQFYGGLCDVAEILPLLDCPELEELTVAPVYSRDLVRLYDALRTKSKFQKIKSLAIVPSTNDTYGTITMAAALFSGVERLTLPYVYDKAEFTYTFNFETRRGSWPLLKDITFNGIDKGSEDMLCSTARYRADVGKPFKRVFLDTFSMETLQSTKVDELRALQEAGTSVVESSRWDAWWPDGTSHRDGYAWD